MKLWTVRAYIPSASYTIGDFYADSRSDAIEQARTKLRQQGNADMCGWSFSAWTD